VPAPVTSKTNADRAAGSDEVRPTALVPRWENVELAGWQLWQLVHSTEARRWTFTVQADRSGASGQAYLHPSQSEIPWTTSSPNTAICVQGCKSSSAVLDQMLDTSIARPNTRLLVAMPVKRVHEKRTKTPTTFLSR
jgi:hypothetical protein